MQQTFPRRFACSRSIVSSSCKGLPLSVVPSFNDYFLSWNDTRTGAENPRWLEQVVRGSQAGTAFSGFRKTAFVINGKATVTRDICPTPVDNTIKTSTISGAVVGFPPSHGGVVPSVVSVSNTALSKLYANARKHLVPLETGVFLGEIRQTLRMVLGRGDGIVKLTRTYLSKAKKLPKKMSVKEKNRYLAKLYLEYQFGWMPLYRDITAGLELIQEMRGFEMARIDAKAQADSVGLSSGFNQWQLVRMTYSNRTINTVSVRYIAGLKTEIADSGVSAQNLGLYPANFVPTLWELLPWSFVIDYFSNVGIIISAMCDVRRQIAWMIRNDLTIRETTRTLVNLDNYGGTHSTYFTPCLTGITDKTITRAVAQPGIPSLEFRTPHARSWQSLNLLMLALARLR